eukprot:1177855-Prorocentrum_minimum.AAC.4
MAAALSVGLRNILQIWRRYRLGRGIFYGYGGGVIGWVEYSADMAAALSVGLNILRIRRRHWARLPPGVAVAEAVGEQLQRVGGEAVLVEEYAVVRGLVGALEAGVAVEVEVKVGAVTDAAVHHRAG